MGEHEPSAAGLLPNGLLPDEAASVMRSLDYERWSKAEERTAELIACIQPNPPSEEQRNAVASYVQRLVKQCFPCQVFTFGSVPLKTYLPDGDIDLTAFCKNESLKETWAHQVRDILVNEEKKENAEFRVKEVQYIQAEVKLIKCLVENIVVDISFNQLGGLCTLCFLEEVDHLINQNHLFKRSIILIKAWCYYESRILGAHHGLISTYALETLVLYIFHVFNNSFSGPLEVLYRFLEFFSKFDWENFCVSLWGPVPLPITSLPEVTAEPPRKDGGDLLLNKLFLDACSSVYAVFPGGQENQGQTFVSKHFNVIDPLRNNNNLGRSVSKGNFFRIRSAFTFGAKRLARLLDCPKEDLYYEVNQFFLNTWDRHGNGQRPDAPRIDLAGPRLSNQNQPHGPQNIIVKSNTKSQISLARDDDEHSHIQSQKNHRNANNLKTSDQIKKETIQRSTKTDNNVASDIQGRILFARTRSSPELSDAYGGKTLATVRLDSTTKKNLESDDSPSSRRSSSSRQSVKHSGDSRIGSNSYQDETGVNDEFATVSGAQGMHQEEQDLVNMMAASANHGFNGQIPVPLNLGSHHLPLPISPSFLASMAYGQRNLGGMVNPWGPNVQFPPGVVPSHMAHYFPGMGLTTNPEDHHLEPPSENPSSVLNSGDTDRDVWHDHDNGGFEIVQADDKQQSTSSGYNFSPSSRGSNRGHAKLPKESHGDEFQYHENNFDDRTATSRSRAGSMRSKTSSESSWEGSSKSKSTRDKRGLKSSPFPPSLASSHGKDKSVSEHSSTQAEEDNRDWNLSSPIGAEVAPHSDAMWQVSRHQITGYEPPQTSGSDSLIPFSSMVLNPNSRPRTGDNSGAHPFTFYATGPPVPFVTMLPVYNYPGDSGSSDPSTSHFNSGEGADISDSGQNFDSSEGLVKKRPSISLEIMKEDASLEPSEHKADILNSDFTSHYQNLQYGRLCQDVRYHPSPMISPVMVHPGYLQGRTGQWDGTGRPPSNNMNIFTQIMDYGHRVLPVAPLQTMPNRPTGVYNRYVEEMPRYRSGTGTYLPNPKASVRDRQSSNTRRGNYSFDRNNHYGDREGNWNASPKSRPSGRGGYGRNDREKANTRVDRLNGGESRGERSWGPHRHDSFSQNGPIRSSSSTQSGSTNVNVPYGVYPVPSMSNHGGASANGPAMASVVMLYPYDQSGSYGTPHPEQLEFGSLGAMGFSGPNEELQRNEDQRFHGSSARQSSPDQPSASQIQR